MFESRESHSDDQMYQMQIRQACPKMCKSLHAQVGSERNPPTTNIVESTSLTELRDYWNNQLYQQNNLQGIKVAPHHPSILSGKSIEPWMLWMPTKEEWNYKILPVALPIFNSNEKRSIEKTEHSENSTPHRILTKRFSSKPDIMPWKNNEIIPSKKYLENPNQINASKLKRLKKEERKKEIKLAEHKEILENSGILDFAVREKQKKPKEFVFKEFTSQHWTTGAAHTIGSTMNPTGNKQITTEDISNYNLGKNVSKKEIVEDLNLPQVVQIEEHKVDKATKMHSIYFEIPEFPSHEEDCNNNLIAGDTVLDSEDVSSIQDNSPIQGRKKKKTINKVISNINRESSKNIKDWRCNFTIKGFNLSDYHRRSKRYRLSRQKDSKKFKMKTNFNMDRFEYAKDLAFNTYDFDFRIIIRIGIRMVFLIALAIVLICLIYLLQAAFLLLTATKENKPTVYLIEYQHNGGIGSKNNSSSSDSFHQLEHLTNKSENRSSTSKQVSRETKGQLERRTTSHGDIYSPNTRSLMCYIIQVRVTEKRSTGERMLICEKGRCEFEGVVVNVDPQIDIRNIRYLRNVYLRREMKFYIHYVETDDILPKEEVVTVEEYYNEYLPGNCISLYIIHNAHLYHIQV